VLREGRWESAPVLALNPTVTQAKRRIAPRSPLRRGRKTVKRVDVALEGEKGSGGEQGEEEEDGKAEGEFLKVGER
jgi:hypothetical protein